MHAVIELAINLKVAALLRFPRPARSHELALAARGCSERWMQRAAAKEGGVPAIRTLSPAHFAQIHAILQEGE